MTIFYPKNTFTVRKKFWRINQSAKFDVICRIRKKV